MPPATPIRLPKALSQDELQALRAVRKNPRDQALLEVLAGCGLRVSEACNLRLDNLHWTSSATPSLRFIGKRSRERVVPMNDQVQDALRRWLDARGTGRSDYVFCNLRTGGHLSRKTVWDAFRRHARHAGVRPVHPHMLRHTFGSDLADRHVPIERIRELMGHASIQTSQIYIAVSAEQKRDAVARLDRRHRLVRWLSRRRNRSYRFWGRPSRTLWLHSHQTIGRQAELRQLQEHLAKGIDTLLIGPAGVGKSHLLGLLEGDTLIRLAGLSPPRQAVLQLAEELCRRGVVIRSPGEGETADRACSRQGNGEPLPAPSATGRAATGESVPVSPVAPAPGSASGPIAQEGRGGEEAGETAAARTAPAAAVSRALTAAPALASAVAPSVISDSQLAGVATLAAVAAAPPSPASRLAAVTSASDSPSPADAHVQPSAASTAPASPFATLAKRHHRTPLQGWTRMVLDSVPVHQWILVIDDLSDLTTSTGRLLGSLGTRFVIVAATRQIRPAHDQLFWRYHRLTIEPLPPADARRLIRQAATGAQIEDTQLLETRLLHQTGGNPRAILEGVTRLRKEPAITADAVRDLQVPADRRQLDLTPILALPVLALIALRFIARGLGDLELYVLAGVASAVAMGLRFFLFRAR